MTHQDQATRHYNVEISALVRVLGDRVRQQICQLRGMSLGGTFIEVGRLSPGTQVNITFGLPTLGEKLSLDAVVHWSTDQGAGVQFEGMRARQVWALWRYLESVTGADPESYYDTVEILTN
ncbi:MAG TPA: PilZ domain-containing protein [Kofleriaceae bacterium]|nr:PilZ domain-containing protein [Kofleriaceae bacterium]HMG57029.1 PilZ domain-containing protein [Kofleriaceae bacterium]